MEPVAVQGCDVEAVCGGGGVVGCLGLPSACEKRGTDSVVEMVGVTVHWRQAENSILSHVS